MTGSRFLDAFLGHFAGGGAFFTGCGLLLAGVASRALAKDAPGASELPARLGTAAGLTGAVIVAFAACPLPRWWFGFAFTFLLGWLVFARPACGAGWRFGSAGVFAAWLLWGAAWEATWAVGPAIPPAAERELVVVGDSLTAGVGRESALWPAMIGRDREVPVVVRAVAGAKVEDVLRGANGPLPETGGVVLVELGGNDVLGGTNPGAFRSDLRTLLDRLRRRTADRGGRVVMLELPLPPGRAAFGRMQRAACEEARVPLVPRRVFAGVLFGPDATVDGLHLSPAGHAAMADAVWDWLGPAFP